MARTLVRGTSPPDLTLALTQSLPDGRRSISPTSQLKPRAAGGGQRGTKHVAGRRRELGERSIGCGSVRAEKWSGPGRLAGCFHQVRTGHCHGTVFEVNEEQGNSGVQMVQVQGADAGKCSKRSCGLRCRRRRDGEKPPQDPKPSS